MPSVMPLKICQDTTTPILSQIIRLLSKKIWQDEFKGYGDIFVGNRRRFSNRHGISRMKTKRIFLQKLKLKIESFDKFRIN